MSRDQKARTTLKPRGTFSLGVSSFCLTSFPSFLPSFLAWEKKKCNWIGRNIRRKITGKCLIAYIRIQPFRRRHLYVLHLLLLLFSISNTIHLPLYAYIILIIIIIPCVSPNATSLLFLSASLYFPLVFVSLENFKLRDDSSTPLLLVSFFHSTFGLFFYGVWLIGVVTARSSSLTLRPLCVVVPCNWFLLSG